MMIFPVIPIVIIGICFAMMMLSKRHRGKPFLMLPLLVVGAFFFMRMTHIPRPRISMGPVHSSNRIEVVESPLRPEVSYLASPTMPTIWYENLAREFPADVYPSPKDAAHALGHLLSQQVNHLPHIAGVNDFVLTGESTLDTSVLSTLGDALQAGRENPVQLYYGEQPGVSPAVLIALQEISTAEDEETWQSGEDQQMQAHVQLRNERGVASVKHYSVHYTHKPWLTNFAAYANSHLDQSLAIAYSDKTSNSPQEASDLTLRQAQRLLAKSEPAMASFEPDRVSWKDLEKHAIVLDRFVQSLRGTAGPIWRQAILLDISPNKVESIKQSHRVLLRKTHTTWLSIAASTAGLILVIFLAYIFLNAATRGYYTLALRVATAAIVLAVGATVFYMMRMHIL
ncbi:hypothetical protein ACFL3F_00435 [Planctomycetota bacterium]